MRCKKNLPPWVGYDDPYPFDMTSEQYKMYWEEAVKTPCECGRCEWSRDYDPNGPDPKTHVFSPLGSDWLHGIIRGLGQGDDY